MNRIVEILLFIFASLLALFANIFASLLAAFASGYLLGFAAGRGKR